MMRVANGVPGHWAEQRPIGLDGGVAKACESIGFDSFPQLSY
jgi:hypothetical protein